MDWGVIITGVLSILGTLVAYFFNRKSKQDEEAEQVKKDEAVKHTDRTQDVSKTAQENIARNQEITSKREAMKNAFAELREKLLAQISGEKQHGEKIQSETKAEEETKALKPSGQ